MVFTARNREYGRRCMKRFSSYGPVNKKLHYHVPRTKLVETAVRHLAGDNPEEGGHYITVWAPRQCGKTWIMHEAAEIIRKQGLFEVAVISLQSAKTETTDEGMLELFTEKLEMRLGRKLEKITAWKHLHRLFSASFYEKPLILIIDEFDALKEDLINKFANEFRAIFISRQMETDRTAFEKESMLHGLALIGVRSVLGVENVHGSPFNVQRSMNIPNLTPEEVASMFRWYEEESGRKVAEEVIQRIYDETSGQPGLVSWFGELLTEGYDGYQPGGRLLTPEIFDQVFSDALNILPSNNILNIISKARQEPYRDTVLKLFRTREPAPFRFDDPHINFLYMNGVIDRDREQGDTAATRTVRFSSPFVQKRLFHYFSREIFPTVDDLYDPMMDIEAVLGPDEADIPAILRLYQDWLTRNRDWLLRDAPRRKTDFRIFEAVFHFNLYLYLATFFRNKGGAVFPEFPTGNGKVDLLIRRSEKLYALELKSFKDRYEYKQSLVQAAKYGASLKLEKIFLIFFIESVDDENRRHLEASYQDENTGVRVEPVFLETGKVRAAPGVFRK